MILSAGGVGQDSIGGDGGGGFGGNINIDAESGGEIDFVGNLIGRRPDSAATSSTARSAAGRPAASAAAARSPCTIGSGTIDVTGDLQLDAEGWGGDVGDMGSGSTQFGGSASGGLR